MMNNDPFGIREIFSRPISPRERLAAFLALDTRRKRGAPAVRERQERVRKRLALILKTTEPLHPCWLPRASRWTLAERWERRALATGDADIAIAMGKSYHKRIARLYASKRSVVAYGPGGLLHSDNTIYGGRYKGWWARWRDAGARVEYPPEFPRGLVVLENHLGTEKARIPIPLCDPVNITFKGLQEGELYGIQQSDATILRFAFVGRGTKKRVEPVGMSARTPSGAWETDKALLKIG
jgi:hypothetical protein